MGMLQTEAGEGTIGEKKTPFILLATERKCSCPSGQANLAKGDGFFTLEGEDPGVERGLLHRSEGIFLRGVVSALSLFCDCR